MGAARAEMARPGTRSSMARAAAVVVAALLICAPTACSDGGTDGSGPGTAEVDTSIGRPGSVEAETKGSGRGAAGETGRPVPDGRPMLRPGPAPSTAPVRAWSADSVVHWAAPGGDGDGLIIGSGDPVEMTEVAAYAEDGTERWRTSDIDVADEPAFVGGGAGVALLEGEGVPLPDSGDEGGSSAASPGLVALDVDTGEVRWEDPAGAIDLIDPDLGIVISRLPDRIGGRVVDVETGEVLWSTTAEPLAICGELVLTSTLVDRAVAVDARTGEGVELHDRPWTRATCLPDGGYVVQAVDDQGIDLVGIDGDGEVAWSHPVGSGVPVAGLTFTGSAIVAEWDDRLVGLDADTGEELWTEAGRTIYAPLVVDVDRIFDAGIDGGSPVLIDARTGTNLADGLTVLSSAPVAGGFLGLTDGALSMIDAGTGGTVWQVPVDAYAVRVADGTVVLDDVGGSFSAWRG